MECILLKNQLTKVRYFNNNLAEEPIGLFSGDQLPFDIKDSIYHSLARVYDPYTCPYSYHILKQNYNQSDLDFSSLDYVQNMINEINEKLDLDEPISTYSQLWDYVDAYEGLSFSLFEGLTPLSEEFEERMEDIFYLGLFKTFNKEKLGTLLSSHSYFSLLQILIKSQTNRPHTTSLTKDLHHIPLTRKYYYFSGHDTSLATYLSALDITNPKTPPYASSIVVELHKEQQYFVKFLYDDTPLLLGDFCKQNGQ